MIILRGHHLFCLQRFKGLGYSPEFVANMAATIARLSANPDLEVRLSAAPDDICRACPHMQNGACRDDGEDAEPKRAAQDRTALALIGLAPEQQWSWAAILRRLRSEDNSLHPAVCGSCQWFQEGTCR